MSLPECKTEALAYTDLWEAKYLAIGSGMKPFAKAQAVRARRRHSRTVIEDQYAEYIYDA